MDAICHLEQKLNQSAITLYSPTPLESSLLQDITVLNGNYSFQLED